MSHFSSPKEREIADPGMGSRAEANGLWVVSLVGAPAVACTRWCVLPVLHCFISPYFCSKLINYESNKCAQERTCRNNSVWSVNLGSMSVYERYFKDFFPLPVLKPGRNDLLCFSVRLMRWSSLK